MLVDVFQHSILNRPFEEIELANGRLQIRLIRIRNHDSLPARKRVEPDFTIRLQLQLVTVEHLESLHVFLAIVHSTTPILGGDRIHGEVFLGKIGDKPVDDSQGNPRFAVDNIHHFLHIIIATIELE